MVLLHRHQYVEVFRLCEYSDKAESGETFFLNQLQIIHKFLHGSNYSLVYFIMYSFVEAKYHSVVQ